MKLRQSTSYLKHQRGARETTGHSTEDVRHKRTLQSSGQRHCPAGRGWNGTKFNQNQNLQLLKRSSWSQLQPCSSAAVKSLRLLTMSWACSGSRRGKTGSFCGIPAAALIASNIHDRNGCRELPQPAVHLAALPAGCTPDRQHQISTGCECSSGGTFTSKAEGSPMD